MKKLIFIFISCCISFPALAQKDNSRSIAKNIIVDATGSAMIPVDGSISKKNNTFKGINFGVGVRYKLPIDNLSVALFGNTGSFDETVAQAVFNHTNIIKFGVQGHYSLIKSKNDEFEISGFGELSYNWVKKERITILESPDTEYKVGYATVLMGGSYEELSIYKGNAISALGGIRIRYSFIYIEASYDVLNPSVNYSEDAIYEMQANNEAYTDPHRVNLNRFSLGLGMAIPLGQGK